MSETSNSLEKSRMPCGGNAMSSRTWRTTTTTYLHGGGDEGMFDSEEVLWLWTTLNGVLRD